MTDQQYDPVEEHPVIEVEVNNTKDLEWCDVRGTSQDDQDSNIMYGEQDAGDDDTGDKVESRAAQPVMALNAVTAREPDYEWRSERPEIAGTRLYQKLPAIADRSEEHTSELQSRLHL